MIQTADIVIVGGGVHGASLAFHLARTRAGRIVLLEKKYLAAGPTARSGALVRPLFTEAAYIQLVLASTKLFERWNDEIGGDAGFVQRGFLRITTSMDPEEMGGDLGLMKTLGVPFEILTVAQLRSMVPTRNFTGDETGIFLPKGGFADPLLTTLGLARAAQRLGVEIIEGVEVTGIERGRGAVQAVQTNNGRIATPVVINCGGVWSDRIAAMAGIRLPIEVHRTPTCIFRRPESIPLEGPILSDGVNRVYLRSLGDSLLRAAHFGWTPDVADPDNYDETIQRNQLSAMRETVQLQYNGMRQTASFGGFSALYDMTPDGHPIIDGFPEVKGFWCDCGWSGNGFASAPSLGSNLAQLILHGKSDIDISAFTWPRPPNLKDRPDIRWVNR